MSSFEHMHPGLDLDGILAGAPFADRQRARASLLRVEKLAPARLLAFLPPLLAESSNPQQALTLFERLAESPRAAEPLMQMEQNPFLVHYALVIFAASQWLGETLIQNPDLLRGFARERNLERTRSAEELHESFARFGARCFEEDFSTTLARFKRREYVRILLRDALGVATVAETTAEISALSDILIDEALQHCGMQMRNRHGEPLMRDAEGRTAPIRFAVLAMGKLGGCELNYSSDVDLLYLFSDGEDAGASALPAQQYFVKLGQELTETLSRVTGDGPVFRMDLRLRPRGHEGEPAVSLGSATRYYAGQAEDWELQALIKARFVAGDEELAGRFLAAVEPFVYREGVNFGAVKTALVSRERLQRDRRKRLTTQRITRRNAAEAIDVKTGRGGIRDIEFLVQCLQRVYGGRESWLRAGGTLFSLQKLYDKAHLSSKDYNELTRSYAFLRKLEHRLQLRRGQQTHSLPQDAQELATLYRECTGERGEVDGSLLTAMVGRHMSVVARIYDRIVQWKQADEQADAPTTPAVGEQEHAQLIERMQAEIPELGRLVVAAALGSRERRNLMAYLASATTSNHRVAALKNNAEAVVRALPIFAHSAFLSNMLIRHPEDVAVFGEASAPSESRELREPFIRRNPEEPSSRQPESAADRMRSYFRLMTLRAAGASVLEAWPLERFEAQHTLTAHRLLEQASALTGAPEGLAIIALGRLGAREFDLLSDADLIFVREEHLDAEQANRDAQVLITLLSSYTRHGTVMAVDTRLRPYGKDAPLVTTLAQMEEYFAASAEAWEALSHQKGRVLIGSEALVSGYASAVEGLLRRTAQAPQLAEKLASLRQRMEQKGGERNVKLGPGGVYDLDYICGYLTMLGGLPATPAPLAYRLWKLSEAGLLEEAEAGELAQAARLYRAVEHAARLAEAQPRKWTPDNPEAAASVELLTARALGEAEAPPLEPRLQQSMSAVRAVYRRIFHLD